MLTTITMTPTIAPMTAEDPTITFRVSVAPGVKIFQSGQWGMHLKVEFAVESSHMKFSLQCVGHFKYSLFGISTATNYTVKTIMKSIFFF